MSKSVYILMISLILSAGVFGQIKIPPFKNAVLPISEFNIPAVSELLKESKVMIMYREYSAWGRGPFDIISFQKDKRWHAYYLSDSSKFNHVISYRFLDSVHVPQEFMRTVWETMIAQDIFSLPADRQDENECDYTIHDAMHYDIKILTQKEYKYLDYYVPHHFEQYCPGNISRQKIMKIISLFQTAKFMSKK